MSMMMLRRLSSAASGASTTAVYTGQYTAALKRLKKFSVTGCGLSLIGSPALALLASGNLSLGSKMFVAGSVMMFGISTTALLNWTARPYIVAARQADKPGSLEVDTLTLFGGIKKHTIDTTKAELVDGYPPFSNFRVAGTAFYMDAAKLQPADGLDHLREILNKSS